VGDGTTDMYIVIVLNIHHYIIYHKVLVWKY